MHTPVRRFLPGWEIRAGGIEMFQPRAVAIERYSMQELARRDLAFRVEAARHERALTEIVRAWRPDLLELCGVGPSVAVAVLIAWSHPGCIRSEAAFAMLAGIAPLPASSRHTTRHQLNPHGDRQLNRAIHIVAVQRQRRDPATRDYFERRRATRSRTLDRRVLQPAPTTSDMRDALTHRLRARRYCGARCSMTRTSTLRGEAHC
jgi:Transposase IS116/IS110/IS902 family